MFARRFFPVVLALAIVLPFSARAQQDNSWVPPDMSSVSQNAAFRTDFTFDRNMLAIANNFIPDEETRRAVAKLNGISVHCYKFAAPGLYDPAGLEAVRSEYRDHGWKHLVSASPSHDLSNPGSTDVWVRFEGADVEGAVVMLAAPTSVNLIAVNGNISTLDLLHLRGHFGIPRFDADHLGPQNY